MKLTEAEDKFVKMMGEASGPFLDDEDIKQLCNIIYRLTGNPFRHTHGWNGFSKIEELK